jgi:hypothetical protein
MPWWSVDIIRKRAEQGMHRLVAWTGNALVACACDWVHRRVQQRMDRHLVPCIAVALINIRPKRFKKRPNWKEQPERPSLTGKQWQ